MNLATVIESHPSASPAIISRGVTFAYGELQDKVAAMRGALDGLGVGKGDRVALLCGNTIEFVSPISRVSVGASCACRSTRRHQPRSCSVN